MEQFGGAPNQPVIPRPLGGELPSDLRVPVGGQPPPVPPQGVLAPGPLPGGKMNRRGGNWLVILVALFVLLLLGGTGYWLIGKINFNKGTVKFSFDPAGVSVTIDGKFSRKSVSGLSIGLRAGEHIAQVIKEGYLDLEREFVVVSGETSAIEIKLEPIPNVEVLAEETAAFPGLVHNGQTLAYMTNDGECKVVDVATKKPLSLFAGAAVSDVHDLAWAPGAPAAMAVIKGTPKLPNVYDNRAVRGRFVPLGERPMQGAPRDRGANVWLFDDARHTAQGWQPVLLNESVISAAFSPDSSRIVYFYWTADGEKSLVIAHPDGGEWERVATQVAANNLVNLQWLNDERHILLFDDEQEEAQLFDLVNKEFSEVMPDRMRNSLIGFSPDGTRIAYVTDTSPEPKLAIWNIASGSVEKTFDGSMAATSGILPFVWQTDEKLIVGKSDGSLWYWYLSGKNKPVQFVSSVGQLNPVRLLYSRPTQQLIVIEQERVVSMKA